MIYKEHLDLFTDQDELDSSEEWQSTNIGAIVLGREMARITQNNEALHERLIRILSDEIVSEEKSQFVRLIARDRGMEVRQVVASLTQVRWGLKNAAMSS